MTRPVDILKQYWGYDSFRPLQETIIESILDHRDTVALLPTGGGKSVCFQIPALLQEGICIVISPLIALMNDQVSKLKKQGIKAMALTGSISQDELSTLLDNCIYGNYKFLYLSPERLQQEMVQARLEQMNINLIAVDEAHCISQWGNDFRPAYKNISALRDFLPEVPFMALTATATERVLTDTIAELKLKAPQVFKKSYHRENLIYTCEEVEDQLYKIERYLKNSNAPAIVYAGYRNQTVEISNHLNKAGISSAFFHGGLTLEEKNKRLENWLNETTPVMVATNAFGMGIDKPNVKLVIHYSIPESIENYFQEAGRAGRDGLPAKAILLYNNATLLQAKKQYLSSLPTVEFMKVVYEKLCAFFQIAYGEGEFTAHQFSFSSFCQQYELNSLKTYNTLQALDRLGVIELSQEFGRKTALQFLLPSKRLLDYFETNMLLSIIGKTLLRVYPGIFEQSLPINLKYIAKKTGQTIDHVIKALQQMQKDQVIDLVLNQTDATITFIQPREDERTINRIAKELEKQNRQKENQVHKMIAYVTGTTTCKTRQLLNYFGESGTVSCGRCNVCTQHEHTVSKKEATLVADEIILLLEEHQVATSRFITEKTTFAESKVLRVLRALTDQGKIKLNTKNEYYLP